MQAALRTPVVRPVGRADVSRLAELSMRLGAESAEEWTRRLGHPGVMVMGAEVQGTLVGYAAGEVRRSFGGPSRAGWIDAFGVDLTYRGHGVGRALLSTLLARLRAAGADHVYTLVPPHDRAMAPFFRELGFRDEAFVPLGRDL